MINAVFWLCSWVIKISLFDLKDHSLQYKTHFLHISDQGGSIFQYRYYFCYIILWIFERGYTARLQFSDIVDEEVNKMKNKYYGEMATKIQARWRGYHTRNYKHNFKARKQYLEVIIIISHKRKIVVIITK